jgi:hypothetical protein
MTVAAKAQYEKVKSETAQAMGDQQIRQQKQQQDDAFRHEKLKQDLELAQQKLEIERAKVFVGASPEGPTAVDPIEAAKVGVDIHQAHLDAALKSHELAMSYATDRPRSPNNGKPRNCRRATARRRAGRSRWQGGNEPLRSRMRPPGRERFLEAKRSSKQGVRGGEGGLRDRLIQHPVSSARTNERKLEIVAKSR